MLNKSFHIPDNDQLLWQIQYCDSEIDKIVANRFKRFVIKAPINSKNTSHQDGVARLPITKDTLW